MTHSLIKTLGSEPGTPEEKPYSMLPSFTKYYINMRVDERVHSRRKKIYFAKTFGRDERLRKKEFMIICAYFLIWIVDHSSGVMHRGLQEAYARLQDEAPQYDQKIAGSHPI